VVGTGIIILSVGVLPLWAAIVGLAVFAMGVGGLPLTSQVTGFDSAPQVGSRIAVVLLLSGVVAWLAWPTQNSQEAEDVILSAAPAPPLEPVAPEPKAASKLRPQPADVLATFSAKHKHRFQDCEGVLTFTVNTIRFQTNHPDDSFVYSLGQVELDNDGVKDRFGKAWHFTAQGRDMEDVFKRWKAGALRAQNTTR